MITEREHEGHTERPLPRALANFYELILERMSERRDRAETGRVVIKRSDLEPVITRNGKYRVYAVEEVDDLALPDWRIFAHEVHTHSGRHTHQGGIVLYVTKGRGRTEVAGKIKHWKAGDLLLLPVVPGGVEHQHWNDDPDEPSEWIAFRYIPFQYALGAGFDHQEDSPLYKEQGVQS